MRTEDCLLPVAACLLMAATAHAQIEIVPPAEPVQVGVPVALEVTGLLERARATVIVYPPANPGALGPVAIGGKFYICFQAADPGRRFVAIAISTSEGPPVVGSIILDVGGESPPDPPDPPPVPDDLATQAAQWLEAVAEEARTEPVENPMTGTTMTRQQAVGATYTTIAKVAEKLGAVRAVNVMLTTGLDASFGDAADEWRPFADRVAAALAEITDAVEYGEALAIVGRVLE